MVIGFGISLFLVIISLQIYAHATKPLLIINVFCSGHFIRIRMKTKLSIVLHYPRNIFSEMVLCVIFFAQRTASKAVLHCITMHTASIEPHIYACTPHKVYPTKCAHGFVALCFCSRTFVTHTHRGCLICIGFLLWLQQRQWRNP